MFILHIGAHKSGSSSIQYFLGQNADKLRHLGVLYPEVGRAKQAHHGLKNDLLADPPILSGWSEVLKLANAHPDKKIVISAEGLETLKRQKIGELRDHLGGVPTLILIYVREPAGTLPSRYNQLTKKGYNTLDFDQFYDRLGPPSSYELAGQFERWADVFGWENLRIRSLDRRSLEGGDLIVDVLSVLGLTLADLGGPDAEGLAPQNVSLGWKTTEVLRALYRTTPEKRRECSSRQRSKTPGGAFLRKMCFRIMQELKLDSERAQYLTAEQLRECEAAYARELLRLNENIVGPKLPLPEPRPITERPFLPSVENIPAEQRAEIARRLAVLLELEPPATTKRPDKFGWSGRRDGKLASEGLTREVREAMVRAVTDAGATELPPHPSPHPVATRHEHPAAAE